MAAGKKQNNAIVSQGQTSWEDLFGINAGGLTNATRATLKVAIITNDNGNIAQVWYTGSAALTLSEYNALPVGSMIFDFQAYKTHYKTAATTWKSSAAAS